MESLNVMFLSASVYAKAEDVPRAVVDSHSSNNLKTRIQGI